MIPSQSMAVNFYSTRPGAYRSFRAKSPCSTASAQAPLHLDPEHLGQLANHVHLPSGTFGEPLRRTGDAGAAPRDKLVISFDRTSGKARPQSASISMCPMSPI